MKLEWKGFVIINTTLYWIVLFLIASAFFSASETSLFSLNKLQQKKMENSGKKSDRRILKLLSKPKFLLITILLGNTLVNISISSFATYYSLILKETYHINLSDSTILSKRLHEFLSSFLNVLIMSIIHRQLSFIGSTEGKTL